MRILLKRGLESNRASTAVAEGEILFSKDTGRLFIGSGSGNFGGNEIRFNQLTSSFILATDVTASAGMMVQTSESLARFTLVSAGSIANADSIFSSKVSAGTPLSPSATLNGHYTAWQMQSFGGSTYSTTARMLMQTQGDHNEGSRPTNIIFSTVPSGSTTLQDRLKINGTGVQVTGSLGVSGSISSNRIGVNTSTPSGEIYFHVQKGSAGTPPSWTINDVALFENTAGSNAYIQTLSSNSASCGIIFSDTDLRAAGYFTYSHLLNRLNFGINGSTLGMWDSTGLSSVSSGQSFKAISTGNYTSGGAGYIKFSDSSTNNGYVGFGGLSNVLDLQHNIVGGEIDIVPGGTRVAKFLETGVQVTGSLGVTGNVIQSQGQGWGVTSTTTAVGTTTLTSSSTLLQIFTGTTTQTVQLPAANLYGVGVAVVFIFKNRSTGIVTLQRAGADLIDGSTTAALSTTTSITLVSDGVSDWQII